MIELSEDPVRDLHAAAFESAWSEFATTCADTIAPEASYQAWLAHFVMMRVGILHVVREVDFGARYLRPEALAFFRGHSLMVDVIMLREPIVNLPRRAALTDPKLPGGEPNPRSGLGRLADFSVISELKVTSTQREGQDYDEVARDFIKLSQLLSAARHDYPDRRLPMAFVGVLDNHPRRRFSFDLLQSKIDKAGVGSNVKLLKYVLDH